MTIDQIQVLTLLLDKIHDSALEQLAHTARTRAVLAQLVTAVHTSGAPVETFTYQLRPRVREITTVIPRVVLAVALVLLLPFSLYAQIGGGRTVTAPIDLDDYDQTWAILADELALVAADVEANGPTEANFTRLQELQEIRVGYWLVKSWDSKFQAKQTAMYTSKEDRTWIITAMLNDGIVNTLEEADALLRELHETAKSSSWLEHNAVLREISVQNPIFWLLPWIHALHDNTVEELAKSRTCTKWKKWLAKETNYLLAACAAVAVNQERKGVRSAWDRRLCAAWTAEYAASNLIHSIWCG